MRNLAKLAVVIFALAGCTHVPPHPGEGDMHNTAHRGIDTNVPCCDGEDNSYRGQP
ncbi:MAG: hypothetical protein ACK4GT_00335 [Pararhodobacter sp.]